MSPPAWKSLSLRDPAGQLFDYDGRLLRSVDPAFDPVLRTLEGPPWKELTAQGRIVEFRRLGANEIPGGKTGLWIEHPRCWFPSYPTEWPAPLLHGAALLTLDLAELALEQGLGLKDATPWNILFQGSEPIFVDLLSFEPRHPEDGIWLPHAQFLRSFIYPLLADRYLGLPCRTLFDRHRDGWDAETLYGLLGWGQRLRPPFLNTLSLPTWLSGGKNPQPAVYRPRLTGNPEKAKFLLANLYQRLRRTLRQVAPREKATSPWTDYDAATAPDEARTKETFLRSALDATKPARLLDLGCNQGRYSIIAAERGIETVSADREAAVLGNLWRTARSRKLPLLPLSVDIARPSPASGWANHETLSFQQRAEGRFDFILAYAILHHLWVGEGIDLGATLQWLHSLKAPWLAVEHVSPEDARVEQLRRGRRLPDLSRARFEQGILAAGFSIRTRQVLSGGTRTLYLLNRVD